MNNERRWQAERRIVIWTVLALIMATAGMEGRTWAWAIFAFAAVSLLRNLRLYAELTGADNR